MCILYQRGKYCPRSYQSGGLAAINLQPRMHTTRPKLKCSPHRRLKFNINFTIPLWPASGAQIYLQAIMLGITQCIPPERSAVAEHTHIVPTTHIIIASFRFCWLTRGLHCKKQTRGEICCCLQHLKCMCCFGNFTDILYKIVSWNAEIKFVHGMTQIRNYN
jgi:hypothetical protein